MIHSWPECVTVSLILAVFNRELLQIVGNSLQSIFEDLQGKEKGKMTTVEQLIEQTKNLEIQENRDEDIHEAAEAFLKFDR